MGNYVSNYTGAQIDAAVGSYLTGNTKSIVTRTLETGNWVLSTTTTDKALGKYFVYITLVDSESVGSYPDIFIIGSDGTKIIPNVKYSGTASAFTIYSNYLVYGTIVLSGSAGINSQT